MEEPIRPSLMTIAKATAEVRGEPLSLYLENFIIGDYERETGRLVVAVFAPEPIDGDWEVVRDEGESHESCARAKELVELIMTAVRGKQGDRSNITPTSRPWCSEARLRQAASSNRA